MDKLLCDQVAIVTGGNAGIGRSIALKFAQNGARVIIFDLNEVGSEETLAELSSYTSGARFYQVNVANKASVEENVKQVLADFGQVDIVVNNAGITRDGLLMKMEEDQWDSVIAVNLKSVYNISKALVRPMMKSRGGKIINIASVIGLTGNAGQANYAASKAGVIGLTKSLAKELASRKIRVNAIAPGFIKTAMTEKLGEEYKKSLIKEIPLGELGSPEDIAKAALFLASDLSSYITGQVLVVDGGMVM